MRNLIEALDQRCLLADGSLARQIDLTSLDLGRDLFGAADCIEVLNITRVDLVRDLHRAYLTAGADVVRTNSLGATALSLAPLGLGEEAFYLNYAAAEVACEAVDSLPGRGRRRFVLGVVRDQGWEATPLEVARAVEQQVQGLLAGGADGVVLDILPTAGRAAIFLNGAKRARDGLSSSAPIFLQNSPGSTAFSPRSLQEADGLITHRHGTADRSDWLAESVLQQQVNLIGGGAAPEETAKLDRLLRSLAEDGPRPRTAWQRNQPIDEVTPPSSLLRRSPSLQSAE